MVADPGSQPLPDAAQSACPSHLLLAKHRAGRVSVDFAFPVPGFERGLCLCQQQEEEGAAGRWGRNSPRGVLSLWPGLLASDVRIGLGLLQGYKTPSC